MNTGNGLNLEKSILWNLEEMPPDMLLAEVILSVLLYTGDPIIKKIDTNKPMLNILMLIL